MREGEKKRRTTSRLRARGNAARAPGKTPWESQQLCEVKPWIAVKWPKHEVPPPETSQKGGWTCDEAFWHAYSAHAAVGGDGRRIGRYLGAEEAALALRGWKRCATEASPDDSEPTTEGREKLIGRDECVVPTPHGWMPRAGCMEHGAWPNDLREEGGHRLCRTASRCLPLFMAPRYHRLHEADRAELDKLLTKYAAAGHITKWRWEWGLPNIVSCLDVLDQPSGKRVIMDARYVNGGVENLDLDLPSVRSIADRLQPGDRMAKFDLKTGYHQVGLHGSDWADLCFEWDGALWCFTVMTLGTRDAPGTFQRFTRAVADCIQQELGVIVEVYLDDFVCIARKGMEVPAIDAIISIFTRFGMVLGAEKCSREWTGSLDVLGFHLDSNEGSIGVTPAKTEEAKALLETLRTSRRMDAEKLASIIGKLNHLNDAVRHMYIMVRPMVNNLVDFCKWSVTPADLTKARVLGYNRRRLHGSVRLHAGVALTASEILEGWESNTPRRLWQARQELCIATDASEIGVGAVWLDGSGTTKRILSEALPTSLRGSSSMKRETFAMLRALHAIADIAGDDLRDRDIHILTDSAGLHARCFKGNDDEETTTMLIQCATVARDAGAELAEITWIPRKLNAEADAASREVDAQGGDLCIDEEWFCDWRRQLVGEGLPEPTVDAYASEENRVLPDFVTVMDGGRPIGIDALRMRWTPEHVLWAFPPAGLARKAWHQWKQSSSTTMYLCLPEPRRGHDMRTAVGKQQRAWPAVVRGEDTVNFIVVMFQK
jgi:hypothetical protein